jgi:hypothetical protein
MTQGKCYMSKTAARIDRIGVLRNKGGTSVMMISYTSGCSAWK